MRSWSQPTESTCQPDCSCEVEAFCGRERSGGPRHARCSRDGVGSGSPQPKSRALARDLELWRALRDSKLRRFAARSTSSRCSFAQGRLKAELRAEILCAAKDRCFAGVSAAGVPGTRGVRVTGWGAGAPKMSADVEPYAAPPALRDCVAKHAHS